MFGTIRSVFFCLPLLLSARLAAGEGVLYEVRPPSSIQVSCPICGFAPPQPLAGTFLLVQDPADPEGFAIEDLRLKGGIHGPTSIGGSGTFRRHPPAASAMLLETVIDGLAVSLEGGGCESCPFSAVEWPVIEVGLSDPRTGFVTYDLHLMAAPEVEYVRYELRPGSAYTIMNIERQTTPLAGTFLLGKVDEIGGSAMYRIDSIAFRGTSEESDLKIRGSGTWIRETAGQNGALSLSIETGSYRRLEPTYHDQGEDVTVPLPGIDFTMSLDQSGFELWIFLLRIVAEPGDSPAFRRGDATGDGAVDISDAVSVLAAAFLDGSPPACEEAGDADADGKLDISDAVSILGFLFLGGREPTYPGPRECGVPGEPAPGCLQPGCEGWPDAGWLVH